MLKPIAAVSLVCLIFAVTAQAQQPSTPAVQVREGMLLKLATVQTMDSNTAKRGDDVPLLLTRAFDVDGVTLLPMGEILHGTVTSAKKVGKKCKEGEIKWKLEQVTFHDGTVLHSKIMLKNKKPNASVPAAVTISKEPISDRVGEVSEAIMLSPILAVLYIDAGIKAPFHHNGCSQYTTDIPLPANATIGVEITETHAVRY